MKESFILLAAGLVLGGCSIFSQNRAEIITPEVIKMDGELITIPSQLRTIGLKRNGNSFYSCAEPGPDVALSATFNMITGTTSETSATKSDSDKSNSAANKLSLANDLQTSTAALELAGRTQVVLLAREFMYRTCEAAANGWLDKPDIVNNHKEIIKQITALIEQDKADQQTKAAEAETAAINAKKINKEIIGNAGGVVDNVLHDYCMSQYDTCVSNGIGEQKAIAICRKDLESCLK